jgi:hypothetical protein
MVNECNGEVSTVIRRIGGLRLSWPVEAYHFVLWNQGDQQRYNSGIEKMTTASQAFL